MAVQRASSIEPVKMVCPCMQDKEKSEKKKDKKKKDNEEEEDEQEPEDSQASPTSRGGRALTPEEAERKGRSILEEYFHLNDVTEAVACVRELNASEGMEMVRLDDPRLASLFVRMRWL